jgi:hypothetical protein
MYRIKEIGIGKKVCNSDGVTYLLPNLSQKKLKRLLTLNCEFIEYVEKSDRREETSKSEEVPSTKESTSDKGNGSNRRNRNKGKNS